MNSGRIMVVVTLISGFLFRRVPETPSPKEENVELPGQRVAASFPGMRPSSSNSSLAGVPAQNGTSPQHNGEKLPFVRSSAPLPTNWRTVTHDLPKATNVPAVAPIKSENRFAVSETESEPRSGTPDTEKEYSDEGSGKERIHKYVILPQIYYKYQSTRIL